MAFDIFGDEKVQAILEGICNQPIIDKPFNETDNPKPMCEGIKMFNGEVFDTNKWCSGGKTLVLSKNSKVGKAKTAPEKEVPVDVKEDNVELTKTAGPGDAKVVTSCVSAQKPTVKAVDGVKVECVTTEPPKSPAFKGTAAKTAESMEAEAKSNKKFAKGAINDPRRWDMLGAFVKDKLGSDGKNKDNVDRVLAHIEEMKKKFAK